MGSLWNRSGLVERYADDLRAAGAKAYFFNGGTTTPLVVFQNGNESSAHPHPVVADANGRWPDVFVPYITSYDVQVKTADDVQLTYTLQIPNPDPVELSVTIPAEERVQTGMIHAELINSPKPGYVRLNGKTIGNGSSTGSERQNADTQALFIYLYNALSDTIAPVLPGPRSGVALTDFNNNWTITLPTWQGAGPIGLDDMGNTAVNSFIGLTFTTGNATTPGSLIGANGVSLLIENLPAHAHSGTTSSESPGTSVESRSHTHSGTTGGGTAHSHAAFIGEDAHVHGPPSGFTQYYGANAPSGSLTLIGGTSTSSFTNTGSTSTGIRIRNDANGVLAGVPAANLNKTATENSHTHDYTSGDASQTHTHTVNAHAHDFTTSSQGSGTAFNNLGRSRLVTWFIKL